MKYAHDKQTPDEREQAIRYAQAHKRVSDAQSMVDDAGTLPPPIGLDWWAIAQTAQRAPVLVHEFVPKLTVRPITACGHPIPDHHRTYWHDGPRFYCSAQCMGEAITPQPVPELADAERFGAFADPWSIPGTSL